MFKNDFITALRSWSKFKKISFINIFGLAVSMACFILIFSFFYREITYDSFNKDSKDIYRVYRIEKSPQGIEKEAETPDPLASTLRNDFPSADIVSLSEGITLPVKINGKTFKEKIFEADPGIFTFFTFPFLQGNPKTALNNPSSVVITKEVAKKYFGKKNALGKTILLLNRFPLVVSGILKKIPSNSSIQLNIVISTEFRKRFFPGYKERWSTISRYTFVKCSDKFNIEKLKSFLPQIKKKYLPGYLKNRMDFGIQPLTSIHLDPEIHGGIIAPISILHLYTLLAIALLIILIACINFMNLSVSKSMYRLKEISVRKVLGAKRYQLVIQFLSESVLFSYISILIGAALAKIFLPEFNNITGANLEIFKLTPQTIALFLLFGFLLGIFSGLYPALLLSSFGSISNTKSYKIPGGGSNIFRKTLLITQFVISIILITSLIFVEKQIHYMKNFNLGFNKENVLVIPLNNVSKSLLPETNTYARVITNNKQSTGIINTSVSENVPGFSYNNEFGIIPEGFDKSQSITMVVTSMDDNFLNTYQIPLFEGRNFSRDLSSDTSDAVIINETALRKIGWKSAIGRTITFAQGGKPYKIIGVIKDFNFKSLKNKIEPLIIRYARYGYLQSFLSVRVNSSNISNTLSYLKKEWQKIIPNAQFNYFFIDNQFDAEYKTEERTAKIIGSFSIIAIMLASLGLFGLVLLTISQKTKEIGIRKAVGASVPDIFFLVTKQFIKIILFADLFAFPVAYLFLKKWLMNYPYRISLNISYFLISGLLVLLIALLTISFQVIRASRTNPVKSLRYE